jgi:subfamily B ATP-binding cassette protein MsbA
VGTALIFGRRLRRITTGVQDRVAEASAVAEEAFSQIRTVQSFVQEPAERARYAERVAASVRTALRRAQVRGVFFGVLTFSTFVGIVVVLWQGGLLVLDGKLTAGALVSFLLYTVTIAASIGALASSFSAYQEAVGAAERVFEILEMRPEIADPAEPETLASPVAGRVEFVDVSFRYLQGEETWTLEDVTLRVAPGQVVALVGPSGGGKTTLVSLLPRFWDVDRGSIRLDGHDVRALRLADLRSAIGIVPQEPALFSGSVRENIAYARPGASAPEVEAAARAAHAHEFIERLPQGYDTLVGERGGKLSGGQRQRVAIARAILKDPAVSFPSSTRSPPCQSTKTIPAKVEKVSTPKNTPRTLALRSAVRTLAAIRSAYRARSAGSWTKLWTVRIWEKASSATAVASATRS